MDNSDLENNWAKVSKFLNNATPEQIEKVAMDMAKNNLLPVPLSKTERDELAQKMIEKGFFTQAEYDEVARNET